MIEGVNTMITTIVNIFNKFVKIEDYREIENASINNCNYWKYI